MYYDFVKVGGRIFHVDINWLAYLKNSFKDSEYSEVVNRKIFSKIKEIFCKFRKYEVRIQFCGTGNANIQILNNNRLENITKIRNRLFGLRNFARLLIKRRPKM